MIVAQQPDVTDKFTTHLIRVTAKGLVSEGTFPRSELEDVIQELQLALIEQAGNFDPEKATWTTFVKTVVRLAAITLRRRRYAGRRSIPADTISLNAAVKDADGKTSELGFLLSEEDYHRSRGREFVGHTELVDHACDVQGVLDRLTDDQREICELLKEHPASEVARLLGISRKKLQLRIDAMREQFREAGLEECL